VRPNLRLVVRRGEEIHQAETWSCFDLIQIRARLRSGARVEKFDPPAAYKFSTYAYWWDFAQGIHPGDAEKEPQRSGCRSTSPKTSTSSRKVSVS